MCIIRRWWTSWLLSLWLSLSLIWNRLGLLLLMIGLCLLLLGQLLLHHHLFFIIFKHAVLLLTNNSFSCRSWSYGLCRRYHNILIHDLVPFSNLLLSKLDVIDPKIGITFGLESFFQKLLILPHEFLNLKFVQNRV